MIKRFALTAVLIAGVSVAPAGQAPDAGPAEQFYGAVRAADHATIERLLAAGSDVNVRDRRGGATPLMYAAALGSVETMRLLIARGADVDARSAAGATALSWAIGDVAKVKLLLGPPGSVGP